MVLACGIYVGFLGAFYLFFDRYTLPVLMLVLLGLLIICAENISFKLSKAILLPFILLIAFSVLSTKDYLNWNRTRWQAIEYLKEQNITFKEIDGGY